MNRNLLFFILAMLNTPIAAGGQSSDTIAINNVNVIPMTGEIVLSGQRVLISNGKIIKIEPAALPPGNNTRLTIDGTGKYLIPGLSEMHYHQRSGDRISDFKLLVANGITTVRNMAETEGQDHIDTRNKVLSGELEGPNYYTTGPYLTADQLQSEIDVQAVVKMHKIKGYNFLKIAGNLPISTYLDLLNECQIHQVPIIGHAQRHLPLEYSLRMKSIEHIEEFLYLPGGRNKQPVFKQGKQELQKIAQQLQTCGIYIGTTLSVFEFINNCLNDQQFAALQQHDLTKYLAKKQREDFLTERNDYRKLRNREFDGIKAVQLFHDYFVWMKHFARTLSRNGVRLLTGSDTYGMVIVGFSLHREFELLQESGIKPYDILLASTVHPARYLDNYSVEGTITEGKNANLVLLNKNPLDNIANTKTIEGVMLKGKWFNRTKLDLMLKEVAVAFK